MMQNRIRNVARLLAAGLLLPTGTWCVAQSAAEALRFTIANPAAAAITEFCVEVREPAVLDQIRQLGAEQLTIQGESGAVPWQGHDGDGDGELDTVILLADFAANQTRTFTVQKSMAPAPTAVKRTQAEISIKAGGSWKEDTSRKDGRGMKQMIYEGGAFINVTELKVPPEHTDHSFFIRYEGPGWESDRVGYRMYLDWRNAIDINGKKTATMVLQNVGLDGFDSYHEMADWGMDILKVGDSLGVGSIGYWDGKQAQRVARTDSLECAITANGDIYSEVRVQYNGWKVGDQTTDLTARFGICAGSRLTRVALTMNPEWDNLCTGLNRLPETQLLPPDSMTSGWTWLATWGRQSLAGDNLGMAVFYNSADLIQTTEGKLNHVVVLRPSDGKVTWYLAAAWEQEPDGIKTLEAFQAYLQDTVKRLNTTLTVSCQQ